MIEKIIEYSIKNRLIIVILFGMIIGWGIYALYHTPVDAIPDLSDNQVIVFTEWPGRSPEVIEDQITYPLASNLQGLPDLKVVRAASNFGFSMIYVIFEDDVDIYWARTRVLERLSYAQALLPQEVKPTLGPDGTGVGHVFWYSVQGDGYDLGELRAIQDWYIRFQLNSVKGVAEVASIGGFVKQYQIDVDPNKLPAYDVTMKDILSAVRQSNRDVGGKLVELNDMEYVVRGLGYVKNVTDIEDIVITSRKGVPVFVRNIATVQVGGDIRRGVLDENGEGEVVGGIIVMRYGENAKEVIDRVKVKIEALQKGLPPGVEIKVAYDRSDLIERAIATLRDDLILEVIIVCIVVFVFLLHFRSALPVILSLPIAVLISFIFMQLLGITSNIMSLGGIAIAVGVLVDASIVMVENAYRHLSEGTEEQRADILNTVMVACQGVGRAIFFSLLIIVISFVPVFLLEGQEGKLFTPLAYTKTFALIGSTILSITLVPVLMTFFMRGRLKPESRNPLSRILIWLYAPVLRLALRFKKSTLIVNVLVLLATIPVILSIGKEFMPALDEGSLLFMPVTLPNVTVTEAKRILQVQDKIIKNLPEVAYVLGKVGRAETATDPAPVSMIETIILLKPQSEWRSGMSKNDIISELDARLQIPGVSNGWTQPIINRINMLATGVRTDIGVKFLGGDLDTLALLARQAEEILRGVPGAVDLYAERVTGGRYLDITVSRKAAARYGVMVGDVQEIIETAIGGMNLTTTVEGRQRFPLRVRYAKDFRSNVGELQDVFVTASDGTQIPLTELAAIELRDGPPMISSENSLLRSIVYLNVRSRDMGSFIDDAKAALEKSLRLPEGYYISWSGQYENQLRANDRLKILVPLSILIIFVLLYFTFKNVVESVLVLLSVPFALIGGVFLLYILNYNFSVAVWVGFIALYGIAVETGVVMVVYLHEALDKRIRRGNITAADIKEATVEGAVLRLRPKVMTVTTTLMALVPIMWGTGTGSDVMKPIATPMIGGMITSAIHVLLVTPVIFALMKTAQWKKGKLQDSGMRH